MARKFWISTMARKFWISTVTRKASCETLAVFLNASWIFLRFACVWIHWWWVGMMIYTTSIKNYQRNFTRSKTSRIRSAVVSLCLLCSLYSKASVVQKSFHQSSHINSNRTTLVISFVIWFTIHSLALTLHSYSQTEIKLVLDFNIQFPALSLTTDSVRPLFWRVCQLFPGRKQTTCAPTIRACVHMITARIICLLRIEVGVRPRLLPRAVFDYNSLWNFLWDSYVYEFEAKCNTSFASGGLSHFQVEKKRSASALINKRRIRFRSVATRSMEGHCPPRNHFAPPGFPRW